MDAARESESCILSRFWSRVELISEFHDEQGDTSNGDRVRTSHCYKMDTIDNHLDYRGSRWTNSSWWFIFLRTFDIGFWHYHTFDDGPTMPLSIDQGSHYCFFHINVPLNLYCQSIYMYLRPLFLAPKVLSHLDQFRPRRSHLLQPSLSTTQFLDDSRIICVNASFTKHNHK